MPKLPEPDDVDFLVGDVTVDPLSHEETIKAIAELRNRPDHRAKLAEAAKILAHVNIDARAYGTEDPQALLDQWNRCVADLARSAPEQSERVDSHQDVETLDHTEESVEKMMSVLTFPAEK